MFDEDIPFSSGYTKVSHFVHIVQLLVSMLILIYCRLRKVCQLAFWAKRHGSILWKRLNGRQSNYVCLLLEASWELALLMHLQHLTSLCLSVAHLQNGYDVLTNNYPTGLQ